MKKILITGFQPFNKASLNPAWEAAREVTPGNGVDLVKLELPVVYGKAIDVLYDAIEEHHPDAVICIGLAQGRTAITPERVAININDASIPDNDGVIKTDETIIEDGKNAYFTKLPIKEIVKNIKEAGLPAHVSGTAGTYVCNNIMYGLLYAIENKYHDMLGGFIHVPCITENLPEMPEGTFAMEKADLIRGLEIAVQTVADVL